MSRPPAVMIQGTGSDVGKSLIVAGLCRLFARRGMRVVPFKPQNMSNNAAATADGGEIGRAQALQARAAGIPATVHLNPVLLKPEAETGAQVIVQGRRWGSVSARDYAALKPKLMAPVLESFAVAGEGADLVLVEGAGSPAEINLRDGDIANMGFAVAADLPVALVADIERGGVIASLVGTHAVLPPDERARIKGFVVNRFRGDPRLFDDGVRRIEALTGWASLGVVPWFEAADRLPAEDVLGLRGSRSESVLGPKGRPAEDVPGPEGSGAGCGTAEDVVGLGGSRAARGARGGPAGDVVGPKGGRAGRRVRIAVPRLPRIANFDDLDPLRLEPGAEVTVLPLDTPLPAEADIVLLPGSKATIADLAALRRAGWDIDIAAHVRRGGRVLGLCGGYQMLGRTIADPEGVEGPPGTAEGLGLLAVDTVLAGLKTTVETRGVTADGALPLAEGLPVAGYRIHMGRTAGPDCARPLLVLDSGPDGAVSADGRVAGSYVHGLFAGDAFRAAWLAAFGATARFDYERTIEETLDALADHLEAALDIARIEAIARGQPNA